MKEKYPDEVDEEENPTDEELSQIYGFASQFCERPEGEAPAALAKVAKKMLAQRHEGGEREEGEEREEGGDCDRCHHGVVKLVAHEIGGLFHAVEEGYIDEEEAEIVFIHQQANLIGSFELSEDEYLELAYHVGQEFIHAGFATEEDLPSEEDVLQVYYAADELIKYYESEYGHEPVGEGEQAV